MSTPATLVRIEWFKLRTTPALPVTLACTLLLSVGAAATNVFLAGQTGLADLGTAENVGKVLAVGAVTSTVMLVIGIMIGAAEHRHRTVVGTYLGEPQRARVLLAQLATGALVGAVEAPSSSGRRTPPRWCCTPLAGCTRCPSTSPHSPWEQS